MGVAAQEVDLRLAVLRRGALCPQGGGVDDRLDVGAIVEPLVVAAVDAAVRAADVADRARIDAHEHRASTRSLHPRGVGTRGDYVEPMPAIVGQHRRFGELHRVVAGE